MNFIVVVDAHYGIGCEGKLLTHLPEDLKYFKEKTLNKVVVMGRTTLNSLPGGKPLPNRTTIVLTHDLEFLQEGVLVVHSTEALFEAIKVYADEDIFIVGGEQIYHQLMPYCQTGYITKIMASFKSDRYLDNVDKQTHWKKIWESEQKEHKGIRYQFTQYENSAVKDRV